MKVQVFYELFPVLDNIYLQNNPPMPHIDQNHSKIIKKKKNKQPPQFPSTATL